MSNQGSTWNIFFIPSDIVTALILIYSDQIQRVMMKYTDSKSLYMAFPIIWAEAWYFYTSETLINFSLYNPADTRRFWLASKAIYFTSVVPTWITLLYNNIKILLA